MMAPPLAMAWWAQGLWHRVSATGADPGVTLVDLFLTLLLAFACGQMVAWTYSWTHRGLSYSREFVQSLMLVSMIVALIMVVVGDSLARAFGLVGALAIVRFRTAVRDTRDIAFVFLALGTGISAGTRHFMTALIGTPVICLAAIWLTVIGFGGRHVVDAFLRFRLRSGVEVGPSLQRVLKRYCRSYSLISINASPKDEDSEHSFQLQLLDGDLCDPLVRSLRTIDGVFHVNLLLQEADVPLT